MTDWWELPGWRDQQKAKEERIKQVSPELLQDTMTCSYFNPECKHEACSYDILTCPKCIEYTKEKLDLDKEREDGLLKTKTT